jgi:hypothetical protein
MMSKKRLLKGLDSHILNLSASITDIQFDCDAPAEIKQPTIDKNKEKLKELVQIRHRLDFLLEI